MKEREERAFSWRKSQAYSEENLHGKMKKCLLNREAKAYFKILKNHKPLVKLKIWGGHVFKKCIITLMYVRKNN